MRPKLFYNCIIHTMVSEEDTCDWMRVEKGRIADIGRGEAPKLTGCEMIDLHGGHVYPCLIDGHIHLLETVAVLGMGFSACEITPEGVTPDTLSGVGERIKAYAAGKKPGDIIAVNNYITTAVSEHRMPTREELDDWAGGRAIVVYSIDGHSTSLSTKMLRKVGIDPDGHSGILHGEDNERAQGRILSAVGASVTLPVLAKGVGCFHNKCAEYGVNIVGALEGNGDSEKDITTKLIIFLARHFDIGVRVYLQYTDINRVRPYGRIMNRPRVGGCGDWEMDGAVGAHSAAFPVSYKDDGRKGECYYSQKKVDIIVNTFADQGYQIASHAIGESAIERIMGSLDKVENGCFHRIEHCEFFNEDTFERLKKGRYALMIQPGYSWIDKRYLHTYEKYLPETVTERMKLKGLIEAGVCVCGSSDSPVQDMDPYLQMLGMTEFYVECESITPYQAMCTYTKNAARAIMEGDEYGTLERGKAADFFTADRDFFTLTGEQVVDFRPGSTYYGGRKYRRKKGSIPELLGMLLRPGKRL